MATPSPEAGYARSRRLNVLRVALTAGLTATAFLLLCWIGAMIAVGPGTHMYVNMFSNAEVTSTVALVAGICWSFAGGLIGGGLFALIYNLLAPLER